MHFRAHRREDYITKMAPVKYVPGATCPQFSNFLSDTFGGSLPLIGYVMRMMGYFLTGYTTEQKWWCFFGGTSTGKSTFIKILHGIMGDYAIALPDGYFLLNKNNPTDFETAHLHGIRLATCVETNEGRRLDVAKIKHITGEDKIRAALKYQNSFEFTPRVKLVLATNHRPHIPPGDDALWRRLKVVPFTVFVPEEKRIPGLAEKLIAEESPGILNCFLAGCEAWQKNGLQEPPEVTSAVKEYRAAEDITLEFLTACAILEKDARVLSAELLKCYREWCSKEGIHPMTAKRFGMELRRLGISLDDSQRHYTGVKFKDSMF